MIGQFPFNGILFEGTCIDNALKDRNFFAFQNGDGWCQILDANQQRLAFSMDWVIRYRLMGFTLVDNELQC